VALTKQALMLRTLADRQLRAAAAAADWVRCPFAPRGPSSRHRRSAGVIDTPEQDRQYMMGHTSAAMTRHYTTTPAIERNRPFVEQITRAILEIFVTGGTAR
jgi:integrase